MSAVWVSVLALVAMFMVASVMPINMGALAFVAAFLVGTLALAMDTDSIIAGFPGDIVLILIGVTYLFGIAQANGTVDLLIGGAVRMVGGRVAALPWVMFLVSATLTAIGALSPAAVAIVAPIALGFAAHYRINTLLMGAMVVHGAQAGSFSPISVYGGIVNGIEAGLPIASNTLAVFALTFVFNFAFAFVLYLVLGRGKLAGRQIEVNDETRSTTGNGAQRGPGPGTATAAKMGTDRRASIDQIATVIGIITLIVLTVGFQLELGFVAMSIAVTLAILFPSTQREAVSNISWSTVLLLGGVLTYVNVLEEAGTIDHVGNAVSDMRVALLAALLLCVIAAVVTALASSTAMLGVVIPLAAPFLIQGEVGTTVMIAALAVSITMTDISPFSTNGALVLANARDPEPERFYRRMLAYTGMVCVAAPAVAWLFIVVPGGL